MTLQKEWEKLCIVRWNHINTDLWWVWKEMSKFGAGLSWREPSSAHLTLRGSGEAGAGQVNGQVTPPICFLK